MMQQPVIREGAGQREVWLLVATFLVAMAGLIYELIGATLSSYLLGDSVRQFSFVIGLYLAAMGLGAWVSRFVTDTLSGFVWAQIALGVFGGFMSPLLFFSYAFMGEVGLPLFLNLVIVGTLVGMELPLIARLLKEIGLPEFRFENVLSFDYIGALAASLIFPLLVIPHLGLMSASLSFGVLNLCVAGLSIWVFPRAATRGTLLALGLALFVTLVALQQSERLVSVSESALFEDEVILSQDTAYQHLALTRFRDRTRLFLDNSIQFDSQDEYRYHEMLVHPAMGLSPRPADVLILGGGDGMAAREVLRHAGVRTVTLVDLDPGVTELFRDHPDLVALNNGSLNDPRVRIVNTDAWKFLEETRETYDIIIADLPDPKSIALSKLYSVEFYRMMVQHLSAKGLIAVQSGSPLFARQGFWSVVHTIAATGNPVVPGQGLWTLPYHVWVPSFGDWGFVLAGFRAPADRPPALPQGLRYLTPDTWSQARVFAPDSAEMPAEINSIQSHALVGYYNAGWDAWFR
jgi:spermidine synthase